MDGINGAALKRLEELASGDDLVGVKQFDFHLPVCGVVDVIHHGFGHMLAKGCAGIGLEAPFDWRLRLDDGRRREH